MEKVLLITHNLDNQGAPGSLFRIAKEYKLLGKQVEVLSYKNGYYYKKFVEIDINVNIVDNFKIENWLVSNIKYLQTFDLIIANTVMTYQIIKLFNSSLPIVWYIHESRIIDKIIEDIPDIKDSLSNFNNIYVVSEYAKDYITSKFKNNNVKVLRNFIDLPSNVNIKKNCNNHKLTFSYLGSIEENKALDVFLYANYISNMNDKFNIQYAGNILNDNYYYDVILRFNEDNIKYCGEVYGNDKIEFFENTDVLVVPSRDESFSLVVAEALCLGIPVIVSDCVGASYMLNDKCSWIFKVDDSKSLCKIIETIVIGEYDLYKYSAEARRQFNVYNDINKFHDNLDSLLNNVHSSVSLDKFPLCTGCSSCINICKYDAITFAENIEGFKYPSVDNNKCRNCGKCLIACPVLNTKNDNNIVNNCYAVASGDSIRLDRSSSGGIFTSIINFLKNDDLYVCGAVFNNNWKVEHVVSNKASDFYCMRGSKYVQSDLGKCFSRIKNLLDEDKYVLFSGTPCQVAGLKSFLKDDYSKLFCVDIVCHGVSSPKVFESYLDNNYVLSDIEDINFRDKTNNGWNDSEFSITINNKKHYEKLLENPYSELYFRDVISRYSCSHCLFQKNPRQGDITIGDFWGIDDFNPNLNDNKGLSCVIVNNKKGEYLYNGMLPKLQFCKEFPLELATKKNPNIISSSTSHPKRNNFFDVFNRNNNVEKSRDIVLKDECDVILLNFWYSRNYGAILTCYALYYVLESLGYNTKVCNYVPELFADLYHGSFSESFANKHFNLTSLCLEYEDLKALNKSTDTFIVGSDQIWRYDIYKEHGGNIFQLSFADEDKRKISCAASFGADNWESPENEKYIFKKLIDRFDSISVREKSGSALLDKEFDVHSDVVGDPVFALDADEWSEIIDLPKINEKPYFFSYILAGGHWDLKVSWIEDTIVNIKNNFFSNEIRMTFNKNYDIKYFLWYLKNSEFVVTDSFHAACFSIIFNKPLIFLNNNDKLLSRLNNIVNKYQVDLCIVNGKEEGGNVAELKMPTPDFTFANKQLKLDKVYFYKWLDGAMKKEKSIKKDNDDIKLINDLNKYKLDYEDISQRYNKLSNQYNELRIHYNVAMQQNSDFKNSASWKVTKPLRLVKSIFRKFI